MKNSIAISLIGFIALAPQLVKAQGAGSYRKVFQNCTLTSPNGITTNFSCRWMWDGVSGGTIFVDNYETDDRYHVSPDIVPSSEQWTTTSFVELDSQACIKSQKGAVVCLVD